MNRPCDLEIGLFEEQWQLEYFARSAIEQVPAAILGVVLRTFHVYRNRAAHSDVEFIRHAMKLTDAWSDGIPLHADSVSAFIWVQGLNPAAMHRLSLLPEPLTGLVVRSFEPKGDRSDWSACFVAHADAIESAWTYRAMDAHRNPPLSPPLPKRLLRAETSVAPTMLRRPGPSLPEAPPSGVATHASSAKDEAKPRPSCKHARVHGAFDPSAPIKISGCTARPIRERFCTACFAPGVHFVLLWCI